VHVFPDHQRGIRLHDRGQPIDQQLLQCLHQRGRLHFAGAAGCFCAHQRGQQGQGVRVVDAVGPLQSQQALQRVFPGGIGVEAGTLQQVLCNGMQCAVAVEGRATQHAHR